ncbi:hypothetical protein GXH09_08990 [Escherichia coli]|nr:hypothetical protein [Escherichia coli]EFE7905034.1 hypothetical protein [Escherichia coli]EFI4615415.1 hypothetical protein [Escherichia coli]EFM2409720.1 hypothetical protein [Escherichia coli]EKC7983647.1 hypothetical protein [Escherichia coli]
MSSLIFYTDEIQAVVATDTLAVDNGKPIAFVSKSGFIPHLKTIVAGTGAGGFANKWLLEASTRMVVRGIQNLDFHTPKALNRLWLDYKKEFSLPDEFTTTVYQFGICEGTGKTVSYAYRSTNDFKSESLGYGTGVKPDCTILEGNLVDIIPTMMNEQRYLESKKPVHERIYIGGEIILYHLTEKGCNCFKIGEFDDYKTQQDNLLSNF